MAQGIEKPCVVMFCLENQYVTNTKAFFLLFFYIELRLIYMQNISSGGIYLNIQIQLKGFFIPVVILKISKV